MSILDPRVGHANLWSLTRAEQHVFELIGQGLTNQELAEMLFVSVETIRTHVKRIHEKLGIVGTRRLVVASCHYSAKEDCHAS